MSQKHQYWGFAPCVNLLSSKRVKVFTFSGKFRIIYSFDTFIPHLIITDASLSLLVGLHRFRKCERQIS